MADIATVFGSVNAILLQGANTAKNLKQALSPGGLETGNGSSEGYTTQEKIGIAALIGVVLLVLFLIWREA